MHFEKKPLALAVSTLLVTGTLLSGCGGSSSGGGGGGNYTMNLAGGNGGTGATAYGGDGGYVDVYLYGGTGGVEVKRSGSASTGFSSQAGKITPHYGTNPLMVESDTTIPLPQYYTAIADGAGALTAGDLYVGTDGVLRTSAAGGVAVYAGDAEVTDGSLYRSSTDTNELFTAVGDDTTADLAAAGTLYMRVNNDYIYTADGDDTIVDPEVTGVEVAKDVTLTLPLNYGNNAYVSMWNDLVNKGTITTEDFSATDRGDLDLRPATLINTGTIDTSGSGTVVNAGYIDIWADYSVFNNGSIMADGADNAAGNGGDAGSLWIASGYYTENLTDLTASGGASTGGIGGDGGEVALYSEYGPALNKGNLTATGGVGDIGGDGGMAGLSNGYGGAVLNSGDIDVSGADGSDGNGGDGGEVGFFGYGGRVASSGNITAIGGNASVDNNAGDGGEVWLYNAPGYSSWNYGTTPHEGIELSGDLMLSGGDTSGTGDGGYGGLLMVDTDPDGNGNEDTVMDQGIVLLGYNTIDTTGGDAQYPGEGGNVDLYAGYGWDDASYTYAWTGPLKNAADIMTSAGAYTGTADTGTYYARGGDVNFETSYYYGQLNPQTKVTNTGDIITNGGGGRNATSNTRLDAGEVYMFGYNGVNNSGAITANGGNDVATDGGTDGFGGNSQWIGFYAELGPVVNSGAITANGGDGEYDGGYGSDWTSFYGPEVKSSGKIAGKGGEADTTLANYYPGYGGWVWMMGTNGPASVSNSASITLTPGTGYTDVYPEQAGYYKVIGAHCEGDC